MVKWLELEEKNRSNLDERIMFLNENLNKFENYCSRVNSARSVKVFQKKERSGVFFDKRYKDMGEIIYLGLDELLIEVQNYDDDPSLSNKSVYKRGVLFKLFGNSENLGSQFDLNQSEMLIELFIEKFQIFNYNSFDEYSRGKLNPLIRRIFKPKELLNWRDDDILEVIRWLMLETDSARNHLLGRELSIDYSSFLNENGLNTEIENLILQKIEAEKQFQKLTRFHFLRSEIDKKIQIEKTLKKFNDVTNLLRLRKIELKAVSI